MSQRRRVPKGNTTLFLEATPRGLVDAENGDEFLSGSPSDFMPALKRANDAAAMMGGRFLAIRVPIPNSLGKAPDSVINDVAFKLALEALNHGRVERIAGSPEPDVKTTIYLILPETIEGVKLRDNRGPPCPRGFLDATPQGLVGVEDPREFLENAPTEFLKAYTKAETENPGGILAMRVPVPDGMTEAEAVQATIDRAWKAYQVNPPTHGGFANRRAHYKEELAAAGTVYTQGGRVAVNSPGASGTKKANKKKAKRAAAGGGIAGAHDPKA